MSYTLHDDRKIGKNIVERIVGGVRDSIFESLNRYRETGDEEYLKNIITLPGRRRDRINYVISKIGQPSLVNLINAYGTISAADMESELSSLETKSVILKTKKDEGETWEQIADRIENALIKGPLQQIRELLDKHTPNYTDEYGHNYNPQ